MYVQAHDGLRDVVVIGGSAGALPPLKRIVGQLPSDLPAAVLVTLHMARSGPSALSAILNRLGGPPAHAAGDGEPMCQGSVVVAIPDHHLMAVDGLLRNTSEPAVNSARPAIDVLFGSAAAAYGPRVIGVILSGGLDDGTEGLAAVARGGGVTIVQSLKEARVTAMPRHAMLRTKPHHVLEAKEIGDLITELVMGSTGRLIVERDIIDA